MRVAYTLLLVLLALSGCGHAMTRANKAPLGHVEMYDGVEHRYQLRIPYRVQVYEIFPTHRYNSSIWIGLNGSGWASPEFPDTFDRYDDDIGGVRWRGGYTVRSLSVRR